MVLMKSIMRDGSFFSPFHCYTGGPSNESCQNDQQKRIGSYPLNGLNPAGGLFS